MLECGCRADHAGPLQGGEPLLGLYPLNGGLFDPGRMVHLSGCRLDNRALLEAVRHLFSMRTETGVRAVSYRLLAARELGSVC